MSPGPIATVEESIGAVMVKYTKLTEKDLMKDPLATEIQHCDSRAAICLILQEHVQGFDDCSKLMACLNVIVDKLHPLSSAPALSDVASLRVTSPPVQFVFSAINILLASAAARRDVTDPSTNSEALVDLFHYIEIVLGRLKMYPEISVAPATSQILVEIVVELTSIFALATKEVNEGPLGKYGEKLLEGNDVERILQRVDQLILSPKTVKPILEVIFFLINNLTLVMEGENASTEGIRRALLDSQQAVAEMAGVDHCYALREKFSRWLLPPDPSINHNIARKANHHGTATWFIEGQTFKTWKTTGGLLWIHGKLGSGKSVLCSTIVDHFWRMCDMGLAIVGYFYVDSRDPAKREARGLLSSLLTQFCTQSDRFCHILSSLHAAHDYGFKQPSENVLAQCLREMLEDPDQAPIFIVVDALDEFANSEELPTPREWVLEILKELVELRLPHVHFCFTSCSEIDIRRVLDPSVRYSVSLHDQPGQIEDIARYVESVVLSDVTMREWPKEEKEFVIQTIAKNGGGMFRWSSCQLKTLRRCPLQKIPSALKALPTSLDEAYIRILQGIDEEKWEYARRIFQFLTVSARPLRVQELAEVFAISIDEETTGTPEFNPRWRQPDAESAVLSACSSLIDVVNVHGEQVVQFSHFSVQAFLTSSRLRDQQSARLSRYYILPQPAHTFLAKACLSVLLQLNSLIHKNHIKTMFPLATYAANYWVGHAQRGDVSLLVEDGMDRLFEDEACFAAWIWVYDIDNPSGPHMDRSHPGIPETAPLYYAALCGFIGMVKRLVESYPEDVDAQGRDGGTPLHAALRNGHSAVALLLLQHNADANAQDNRNETPLHLASRRGDIKVMQILIDSRAKLNAKNKDKETPLSLASSKGSLETAQLLLKYGADVDYEVAFHRTALHVAAEHGHFSVANLLLSNGANVDARDRDDRTPLHLAADHGKVGVTRLLLQRRADVNSREVSGLTPLHMVSSGGQVEAARVLLDFKAGVDARNRAGWTALHMAAYNGHLEVAKLLLTRGAAWDSKNNDGSTPFEVALESRHTEITQMLQQASAAENQRSRT